MILCHLTLGGQHRWAITGSLPLHLYFILRIVYFCVK